MNEIVEGISLGIVFRLIVLFGLIGTLGVVCYVIILMLQEQQTISDGKVINHVTKKYFWKAVHVVLLVGLAFMLTSLIGVILVGDM